MTDEERAARLAAIRANRGQAPIAPAQQRRVVAADSAPAATTSALPPLLPPAPPTAPMPLAPPPAAVAAAPVTHAPTPATISVGTPGVETPRAGGPRQTARRRRPHVAAGARILTTGLAASAVFGLTTVLAEQNQPASDSTDTGNGNEAGDIVLPVDPATTPAPAADTAPAPTDPAATQPPVIVLAVPGMDPGTTVTVTTVPGEVPSTVPGQPAPK